METDSVLGGPWCDRGCREHDEDEPNLPSATSPKPLLFIICTAACHHAKSAVPRAVDARRWANTCVVTSPFFVTGGGITEVVGTCARVIFIAWIGFYIGLQILSAWSRSRANKQRPHL